jgi:phenylacetate-CoA ligase
MNIAKIIYNFGITIRNKKIFNNYDFLLKSQYWKREKFIEYQFNKLISLLKFALVNSNYYKKQRGKYNIDKLRNIDDIVLLPELTKDDLLNNTHDIQVKSFNEKMYYSETSGSTGKPLIFYRNQDWDAWVNASVFRGYSWFNVKPWERNGYLWGYNFDIVQKIKTILFDVLQNRFRLFTYKSKEIDKFCRKLKHAKYLNGYSSMIYEIAKRINKDEKLKREINLSFIKGTSEKIYNVYQEEAVIAFGRKIISEYGSAEAGIIAFECPMGNMHINMETVIVEEVDKEIVVTNLVSKSFPVIRYRLGDYITLDKATICACGRKSYILKDITGRVGKKIYGMLNEYPSLTLYYIFKNLAINHKIILNYQVEQRKRGELIFKLEQSLNDKQNQILVNEIKKYFKNDINVTFETGVHFKSEQMKQKDFISYL